MSAKGPQVVSGVVSRLLGILCIAVCLAGCRTVFTGIEPDTGETCDEIEIGRDMPERRHRCGNHIVQFEGASAEESCLEGLRGANQCAPPRPGTDLIVVIPESWPARMGTVSVEQSIRGTGCGLLGAFSSGRYEFPFEVTRRLRSPGIRFSASSMAIDEGDSATLDWTVTGTTTAVRLDTDPVPATGTRTVSPRRTTSYTLTAENRCLVSSETVDICVNETQEPPEITAADGVFPGERLTARGRFLAYSGCGGDVESALLFAQGTTSPPPVVDPSPSSTSLDATLPGGIMPGDATVVARVGTLSSSPFSFTVRGRSNGPFGEITLIRDGSTSCTSGGVTRSVSVSRGIAPEDRVATFSEGGRTLSVLRFTLGMERTGAGFSPACKHAVAVGENTARTDDRYTLQVDDLDNSAPVALSETELGRGVQVLFSPDDSVVLYKAQDDFAGGPGHAAISLHDMQRTRPIPGPGPGVTCTLCDAISASVDGYRGVTIVFDGRTLVGSPFPIE